MKIFADYHTHTVFSHGTGGVVDNVETALSAGLTAVGITDHGVANLAYGIKKRQIGRYIETIEAAKKRYGGRIEVKSGLELNLIGLDGSADIPEGYKFDMLILGFHKSALPKDIKTAWTFVTGTRFGHINDITNAYMLAIQRRHLNIISHPGYGVPVDYRMLGRACADYGTLFEINEKHAGLSAEDINAAASEGARFVISSDAHRPQDVGRVKRALALAGSAGLSVGQIANARDFRARADRRRSNALRIWAISAWITCRRNLFPGLPKCAWAAST
jgi:putative hydrolase